MSRFRRRGRDGQQGQGLVELALVIPIVLALVVSVGELGLIFGKINSLGYASREGARTGAALALGDKALCTPSERDPSNVDAVIVSAVQRILKSPDSGIDLDEVDQIRIFKANETGGELDPGLVNIWTYLGPGLGPDVIEGEGQARIDFGPSQQFWRACDRDNGADPDSIGVTVAYTYDFVTPLPAIADAISGGNVQLSLSETTVMALNPSVP